MLAKNQTFEDRKTFVKNFKKLTGNNLSKVRKHKNGFVFIPTEGGHSGDLELRTEILKILKKWKCSCERTYAGYGFMLPYNKNIH